MSFTSIYFQIWLEITEDIKVIIRIRKTMAERKNDKETNYDLKNTTQKIKDRAKRIQLKSGVNLDAPEELLLLLH